MSQSPQERNRLSALNDSTVLMAGNLKGETQSYLDTYAVLNGLPHGEALERIISEHRCQAAENEKILGNMLSAACGALEEHRDVDDKHLIEECTEAVSLSRMGRPLIITHPIRAITLKKITSFPSITVPETLYLEQVRNGN